MLITVQNSELIDKLVMIAKGDVELVHEAIRACAGPTGAADLKRVVDYITARAPKERAVA